MGRHALLSGALALAGTAALAAGAQDPSAQIAPEQWERLRRNLVVLASDGSPVGPSSLGEEVVVPGFANSSRTGALVIRDRTLVRCDGRSSWVPAREGQYLVAKGTLTLAGPSPEVQLPPGAVDFEEPPVFELKGCEPRFEARRADVPAAAWQALEASHLLRGAAPSLGMPLQVEGSFVPFANHSFVVAGGVGFSMDACVGEDLGLEHEGQRVSVTGKLSFEPPRLLSTTPTNPLVAQRTGLPSWFSLADCSLRLLSGRRQPDPYVILFE